MDKLVIGSAVEPAKFQLTVEPIEGNPDLLLVDTSEWGVPNSDDIALSRAGAEELRDYLDGWLRGAR